MSSATVSRLDEYRDRRQQRLRLTRALHRVDPAKEALLDHLVTVADLTASERVAAVWVDEYGPGIVHPHVVLDVSSDQPRRDFPIEALRKAWEYGIPGTHDQVRDGESVGSSVFAVALGSDGSRAWFLVAESLSPRSRFASSARDRLLFAAGECSSLVLHRDFGLPEEARAEGRFAGWHILQDVEGREADSLASGAIARRFLVGRLARMLVDEDLSIPDDQRADQARRARVELHKGESDESLGTLDAALDLYAEGDLRDFGQEILRQGRAAEDADHFNGALELYRCAFDIGTGLGSATLAIDAARQAGRVLRRRARWDEADRWYGIAFEVADSAGIRDLAARALSGLALIKKEIGNLPAARAGFEKALEAAEQSGDRDTLASIHQDLLGLEHAVGDLGAALRHGWRAVKTYESDTSRMRCMVSLAGVLKDVGELQAAEDAYTVVAHRSDEHYYLVYATDALAHIAALRGDEAGFSARAARCDALGWENGPLVVKAEILYFRGQSYQALDRGDEARAWFERAIAFAEEHNFNRVLFRAESALRDLPSAIVETGVYDPVAPPEVREGLRAMREELAGVGA
ncbi:MAG: tetratricopeptide repeat protein [Gemmatimonadetes bacterium]|nr:tetratricopeptide repeat protein [Gemmatimonadota bacterium]MDA1104707.1 tetratricopeptide repeat protein [Gemmatimonadota bacterium]